MNGGNAAMNMAVKKTQPMAVRSMLFPLPD
jgi:hypothetical protein